MPADGDWKVTMNTPMGARDLLLSVTTSGSTFTGTTTSDQSGQQPISGTVKGDTLKWESKMTSPAPMTLKFTVTTSGDTLSGEVKLGMFGSAKLTGVRA